MKIAFLFITKDDINQPIIWQNYLRGNETKYNLYVHPKNPNDCQIPWIVSNIIPNLVPTDWGHIISAYYELFKHATQQDDENKYFIVITESCIPVLSFAKLYSFLLQHYKKNPKHSFIRPMKMNQYDKIARIQTQEGWQKICQGQFFKHSSSWCLSRYHTELFLQQPKENIAFFEKMKVGDEYWMTLLQPQNDANFVEKEMTYYNWEYTEKITTNIKKEIKKLWKQYDTENGIQYDKDAKKSSSNKLAEPPKPSLILRKIEDLQLEFDNARKHPKTYNDVVKSDVDFVFKRKVFFWRKFPKSVDLSKWYDDDGTLLHKQMTNKKKTKKRKQIGSKINSKSLSTK